ncbi:MAG: hypothetical protein MI867_12465 [Pseudomonadales bacterium]|nr:hypothetical protein [Pseudomonadales bacterium]
MDKIRGIIRHILTFGGGFLVGKGYLTEESMIALVNNIDVLIGSAITVWGGIWSLRDKMKNKTIAS